MKGGNLTVYTPEKGGNYYSLSPYGGAVGGVDPAMRAAGQGQAGGGFLSNILPDTVTTSLREVPAFFSGLGKQFNGVSLVPSDSPNPTVAQGSGDKNVPDTNKMTPPDVMASYKSANANVASI